MLKIVLLIILIGYNLVKLTDGLYNLQINKYDNKKYNKWIKSNFLKIYKKSDILIAAAIISLMFVKIEIKIITISLFAIILIINNLIKLRKQNKNGKIIIDKKIRFITITMSIIMLILTILSFTEKATYSYIFIMIIMNIFIYYLIALLNINLRMSRKH